MTKALLVTAVLVVAIASPARAQSYNRDSHSAKVVGAPYAGGEKASVGNVRTSRMHRRAARSSIGTGYAQSPPAAFARTPAFGTGYRWPGAKYDADGRFVDQNSPGRW